MEKQRCCVHKEPAEATQLQGHQLGFESRPDNARGFSSSLHTVVSSFLTETGVGENHKLVEESMFSSGTDSATFFLPLHPPLPVFKAQVENSRVTYPPSVPSLTT